MWVAEAFEFFGAQGEKATKRLEAMALKWLQNVLVTKYTIWANPTFGGVINGNDPSTRSWYGTVYILDLQKTADLLREACFWWRLW